MNNDELKKLCERAVVSGETTYFFTDKAIAFRSFGGLNGDGMSKKSPYYTIVELFPKPEEAKYPNLKAAQEDALHSITDDLANAIRDLLEKGHLVIQNGIIIPDHEKIEADKKAEALQKKYKIENRKVFIYALIDPRNDEVKYVGQTENLKARFRQHISNSHSPLINDWVAELKSIGEEPILTIVDETISKKANALEMKWIKQYSKTFKLLNTIIYKTPRSRAGVAPPTKEPEKPKSEMEKVLDG